MKEFFLNIQRDENKQIIHELNTNFKNNAMNYYKYHYQGDIIDNLLIGFNVTNGIIADMLDFYEEVDKVAHSSIEQKIVLTSSFKPSMTFK
jgi:hypothetical protein